jgi:hypothetical protein
MNDEVTVIGRLCAARLCSAIRNSRLFRWRFLLNDVGVFSYLHTISRVGVWSAGSTPRVGLGALAGSDAIASYLTDADSQLDIDGDGESKPLTDGLLLIRYLFGFSGDSLISGAIGDGAERDTAEEVEAYIEERIPVQ